MEITTRIEYRLDAIEPRSGADQWARSAQLVVDPGDEPLVYTRECVPGGGFPVVPRDALQIAIPLGYDYRRLEHADEPRRLRELIEDYAAAAADPGCSRDALECAAADVERELEGLLAGEYFPAIMDAWTWMYEGDGVDTVIESILKRGSIAAEVEATMWLLDVTIIGGADAIRGVLRDGVQSMIDQIEADELDNDDLPGDLLSSRLALAGLRRLLDEAGREAS